jgi:hypothetical protein
MKKETTITSAVQFTGYSIKTEEKEIYLKDIESIETPIRTGKG